MPSGDPVTDIPICVANEIRNGERRAGGGSEISSTTSENLFGENYEVGETIYGFDGVNNYRASATRNRYLPVANASSITVTGRF